MAKRSRRTAINRPGLAVACGVLALLLVSNAASLEFPVEPPRWTGLVPGADALAWVTREPDGDRVVWNDLAAPAPAAWVLWRTDGAITDLQWLGQNKLLVMVKSRQVHRWYQVNWPNGGQRLLLSEPVQRRQGPRLLRVLDNGTLLLANDRRRPWQPDLIRLDEHRRVRIIEQNPGNIFRWHLSPQGVAVLARRWQRSPTGPLYEWLWRPAATRPWQRLRQRSLEQPPWRLLGFKADASEAWLAQEQQPGRQILDLASGQFVTPQVAPAADGPDQGKSSGAVALLLENRSLPSFGMDRQSQQDLKVLQDRKPESSLHWLGRASTGSVWQQGPDPTGLSIVAVNGGRVAAWKGVRMAPGHPVTVAELSSRDNQPLEVFITRPRPQAKGTVVLIHGGPWSQDRWTWHPEAQWLADLGYLVLQVNFRGSTNRGVDWQWAGRQQWATGMLDDLEDALRWIREQGISGAGRACAMGSSYGGYAALMLASRPDPSISCVVARAPVTDLPDQIHWLKTIGNLRGYWEWREMVGDPSDPALQLGSPVQRVQNLVGPLLLAHGDQDQVVDISQSRRLLARLSERQSSDGVDGHPAPVWLPLEGVGHDLTAQPARRQYYRAVAEFLDRALADER